MKEYALVSSASSKALGILGLSGEERSRPGTPQTASVGHNNGGRDSSDSVSVDSKRGVRFAPETNGSPRQNRLEGSITRSVERRSQHVNHMALMFETDFEDMVLIERVRDWASSFRRTDPRYQIMKFFNDCAQEGVEDIDTKGVRRAELISPLLRVFKRSAVFTVWRPTSVDAIRKMMQGRGTGKGLDIKGKSAKGGKLSGYVPFVQIHDEEHKLKIRPLSREATIRVFYRKREPRDEAVERLNAVAADMQRGVEEARAALADETCEDEDKEKEAARVIAWWDVASGVEIIEDYAKRKGWGPFGRCFGIELPERIFWEAYVVREDVAREPGSEYDTCRGSEPAYQDMNFGSTRAEWKEGKPRAVVWQYANPKEGEGPMDPRTLLVSYEEQGRVLPVVSDFDCFLTGTRGVTYEKPLPTEQVDMLNWCVTNIEETLDEPKTASWSGRWLDVLKHNKPKGKGAKMPQFGYGDPKSYSIMEYAVGRLQENGAVRHGAECFNFYFPQDLDDEYLVILGDAEAGKVPWLYVNEAELREILCQKIDRGFTFPLNPKWVLCDRGWKTVYDKLIASQHANVQHSLNCWYPPESGVRERIECIHKKHPGGFVRKKKEELVAVQTGTECATSSVPCSLEDSTSSLGRVGNAAKSVHRYNTEAMDLAHLELERYLALERAKRKLRIILHWMVLATQKTGKSGDDWGEGGFLAEVEKTRERLGLSNSSGG